MSPEAAVIAQVQRALPGVPWACGIDHKGSWARVGETQVRMPTSKGRPAQALEAALAKALAAEGARA